jgi:membrane-associated phospholipid phosphatase
MGPLQEFSFLIIQALQTLSPTLDVLMNFFTFLGRIEFYILLIALLYWVVNNQLGFRVFLILLSTDFVSSAFKHLLHQPRPYWVGDVKHLSAETSYGIPSSHASDSLAVWGYLAYRVQKSWFRFVAVLLIVLIALSRLYLGVHFLHDILGGWLIGGVMLFTFIKYDQRVSRWLESHSANFQIGFGLLISLLIIATGLIILALIAATPDPQSWAQYSSEVRSPTHYFTLAGAFFGGAAGYVLMKRHARFETGGTWIQQVGRYIFGIVFVFVILYGLDALFGQLAADESVLGYILRYIRYGATTFWVVFGAPWAFLKLRLAEPSP